MLKVIPDSHTDHYPAATIEHIVKRFQSKEGGGFFIETFELPEGMEGTCKLHGPATGEKPVTDEEAEMLPREGRDGESRFCKREGTQTRVCTVVAGPEGEDSLVLYTAYPGPVAPREPDDGSLETPEEIQESKDFWAQHALSQ